MNHANPAAADAAEPKFLSVRAKRRQPSLPHTEMTLSDAFQRGLRVRDKWLTAKDKNGLRQGFEKVAGYFGLTTKLNDITRDDVLDWRFEMLSLDGRRTGTTMTPSTVNHRLSMLSVLLDIAELPGHKVKHLSTRGNQRMRRVSDEELGMLPAWLASRDHLKGAYTFQDLVIMALQTGARQGELLGLKWIDVAAESLTFRDTKNGESRTVWLRPVAQAVMARRVGYPDGPFTDLDKFRMTVLWADFREFLGLQKDDEFVFHALRHESLSRMADGNANAFGIQAVAGHSNITTTQRYVKSSLAAMKAAMSVW